LLCALAFLNSLKHGFVMDDVEVVLRPQDAGVSPLALLSPQGRPQSLATYRPVRELSFRLDHALWGARPFPFHLTNTALYAFNALLVYWLAVLTCGQRLPAILAALLFALHPAHSEAVCWIKNRGDLLAGAFVLASTAMFMTACPRSPQLVGETPRTIRLRRTGIQKNTWLLAAAAVCFAAALLTMEAAAALPLALTASVLICSGHPERKRGLLATIPFWALLACYTAFTLHLFSSAAQAARPHAPHLSLGPDLAASASILLHYLRLAFLPVHLSLDRAFPLDMPQATVLAVAVVVVVAYGLAALRGRIAIFWLTWFFAFLLPVSLVVIRDRPTADHRLFLPSIGWAITVACILTPSRRTSRPSRSTLVVASAAILCATLIQRNFVWSDASEVWKDAIRKSPTFARPHKNVGQCYLADGNLKQAAKAFEKFILRVEKGRDLHVESPPSAAHEFLANLYDKLGDTAKANSHRNAAKSAK